MNSKSLLSGAALALALATVPGLRAEDVDFQKQVLPIFEKHCFECHQAPRYDDTGRLKKPKSGLRMDNPELLLEGGDGTDADGGETGVALTPGDPDKSTIYTFMMLADDHEYVMPPEKKDRMTAEEKEVVKQWIAQGAKVGDWKGAPKEVTPTPPQ
ncbi:MAG: hypothetical protein KDK99_10005 [Verrucomicrobiales bacterium]|nr:hypothetical protein [Verrucomicrobiales bacterium]